MRRSRMRGSIGGRATARAILGGSRGHEASASVHASDEGFEADEVQLGLEPTPVASCTRRRTRSISAYTSAACAPGSATKKLACFSETTAPPTRAPLQPAASMSRPAESPARVGEHRSRVLPAGLMLAPPAHDLVDARRDRGRVVGAPGERRGQHHRRGADSAERAVAEPELRRRSRSRARAVGEVEHAGAEDHVGGLRAVAARVHAHRAADRAGDPDEELEPGDARRAGPAGEHRERRPRRPRAPAGRWPVDVELLELAGERDRDAGEAVRRPRGGSSRARSRAPGASVISGMRRRSRGDRLRARRARRPRAARRSDTS